MYTMLDVKADLALDARLDKYGLTRSEYIELLEAQQWRCAICGGTGQGFPQIDHCHISGQPRLLLCRPCNIALGMFDDSHETLLSAAAYVSLCRGHLLPDDTDLNAARLRILGLVRTAHVATPELTDALAEARARYRAYWDRTDKLVYNEETDECT